MDNVGPDTFQALHVLGEGVRSPVQGDHIGITYSIFNVETGKRLHAAQRHWVHGHEELNALHGLLEKRVAGDSVSYVFPAHLAPWDIIGPESSTAPSDSSMLKISLRIDVVMSQEEAAQEAELYNEWTRARRKEADASLKKHLYLEGVDAAEANFAGVYVVVEQEGDGEIIAFGDQVTLDYQATFLDGTVFDDTYASGTPLVFKCGVQGQVIWGLSLAVRKLSVGSKARVYIPYAFGFGQEGSSTGIVPPFANLVYDLKVREMERP